MIGSVRWVTGVSCRCAPNEPSTILPNGLRIANHFGTRVKKAEYLQDPSQNPLNLEGSIGCPGRHKWCLTATVSWAADRNLCGFIISRGQSRLPNREEK